jgi:hypothetical protein
VGAPQKGSEVAAPIGGSIQPAIVGELLVFDRARRCGRSLAGPTDGLCDPVSKIGTRNPPQLLLHRRDIGTPAGWIIDGALLEVEFHHSTRLGRDRLCELTNGDLFGAPEVDRIALLAPEEQEQNLNKVGDETQRSGLAAVSVDREVVSPQRRADEHRNGTTVVDPHPQTLGVEYPGDRGIRVMLPPVCHRQRLGIPMCFVVHRSRSIRIHIPPIRLLLLKFCRLSIHCTR